LSQRDARGCVAFTFNFETSEHSTLEFSGSFGDELSLKLCRRPVRLQSGGAIHPSSCEGRVHVNAKAEYLSSEALD